MGRHICFEKYTGSWSMVGDWCQWLKMWVFFFRFFGYEIVYGFHFFFWDYGEETSAGSYTEGSCGVCKLHRRCDLERRVWIHTERRWLDEYVFHNHVSFFSTFSTFSTKDVLITDNKKDLSIYFQAGENGCGCATVPDGVLANKLGNDVNEWAGQFPKKKIALQTFEIAIYTAALQVRTQYMPKKGRRLRLAMASRRFRPQSLLFFAGGMLIRLWRVFLFLNWLQRRLRRLWAKQQERRVEEMGLRL